MRVLHVIPSVSERSGGPGHAIISMCRSLQEQGTEVVIATTNHGIVSGPEFPVSAVDCADIRTRREENGSSGAELITHHASLIPTWKGVPTLFFPLEWGQSFKYSQPLALWLDANVKTFDVVHIHAVFNHACIAAARACRKHKVPYVVRPLGTLDPWSMKQKPLRKFLFWHLAGRRMLRAAAVVHYTAKAEKSAAEQSLALNHGRVIPLGVETDLPASANGSQLVSRKLAGLAGKPYVLVLSRLHPKKGLDIFVDAFLSLKVKKTFNDWRLVLAGEGPSEYVAALKRRVAAQGADDVVLFPGWLEGAEKDAFLRHASLLALPSYHENFGLCVMEALAAGVPVLVSPHVNLAAEIESAGAGWIAALEKPSLESALAEALAREDERAKRGRAGKTLSQEFSCGRVATRLNEMYSSVSANRY